MSIPETVAATQGAQATLQDKANSFLREIKGLSDTEVSSRIDSIPDEALKLVVTAEKRYRDTQGAYTKSQQELKAKLAELDTLKGLHKPQLVLEPGVKEELEDLKLTDPDRWRARLNQLERESELNYSENLTKAGQQAQIAAELERRSQVLADFNASYGLNIDDSTIEFDIPGRITKKLEKGEVSFEDFLLEVKDYLETPKVVGSNTKTLNQPNLTKAGGDSTPTKDAVEGDIKTKYKAMVF